MYVYSICEIEDLGNYETGFDYIYLIHKKELSKEEFDVICTEGLSKIEKQSTFDLKRWLIEKKGFEELPVVCNFDFDDKIFINKVIKSVDSGYNI